MYKHELTCNHYILTSSTTVIWWSNILCIYIQELRCYNFSLCSVGRRQCITPCWYYC